MYSVLYFYCIPKEHVDIFLRIQKEAAKIYQEYGAIGDWTFSPEDLTGKYGCVSFQNKIEIKPNEDLYFSMSLFESKIDHDRMISLIDNDKRIEILYLEISKIIDLSRVTRGEFNRVI